MIDKREYECATPRPVKTRDGQKKSMLLIDVSMLSFRYIEKKHLG